MGWEQIYEQWKNHQQLEAGLKDQLTELEKDPEMLQDAFYMPASRHNTEAFICHHCIWAQ